MSKGGNSKRDFVENVYRRALVLFPCEFRERYADQMVRAFTDASNDAQHRTGRWGAFLVRARMYAELLFSVPREWLWVRGERRKRNLSSRRVGLIRAGTERLRIGFLLQDLRYALRRLAKDPGFASVAILTLAIGIGANTAIFSIVNAVLIRDRPYRAPHELVNIYSNVDERFAYANSSFQDLLELRTLEDLFAGVGAYSGRLARVAENDEVRPVFVEAVTHNLFPLLGLNAQVGRTFLPEEDLQPGSHSVVILGHAYWQRRFAGQHAVLGQAITLGGAPYTIVGVMPEALESLMIPGLRTDLFVPMMMAAALSREGSDEMFSDRAALDIKIIGRLQSDVQLESASTRVESLSRQLKSAYPDAFGNRSFHLVPTLDVVIQPDFDAALLVPVAALLMTMVGLVLLLTCTNLASLLLARGVDRNREFAVRLALGAHRTRLVNQLLSETMLLGVVGCLVGLVAARWLLVLLTSVQPPFWVPIAINYSLDGNVLLFTLGITAAAGLLAGLAPALWNTRTDIAPTLRGEAVPGKQRRLTLRSSLVAIQIVVSTVLLVGGGLFMRSLQEAQYADPGFSTREAGIIWLDLGVSGVPDTEWSTLTEELTERVRALPGIDVVGASNGIPLAVGAWSGNYDISGVAPPAGEDNHTVRFYCIDRSFFDALGIRLVSGRGIMATDRDGSEPVTVVSEAAANRFWPGENPLGKSVTSVTSGLSLRVVGVAADIKIDRLDETPQPLFYLSQQQHRSRADNVLLVARGPAAPSDIARALQQVIREEHSNLVVMTASTLNEQFSVMLFPFRAAAGLLGAFGVLALILAAVGLYGIVSFAVSRRTREVGIRISLGAESGAVTSLMVRDMIGVVLASVAVGLVVAFGIARFLRNFLIGVEPSDPVTMVCVPVLLCGVALTAALVPARRASRVSPVDALRYE